MERSLGEGVGSPLGWKWATRNAGALRTSAGRKIGLQNGQPPGEFTDRDQPFGLEWSQPGLPQFGKRRMVSLVCLLSGPGML